MLMAVIGSSFYIQIIDSQWIILIAFGPELDGIVFRSSFLSLIRYDNSAIFECCVMPSTPYKE